MDEYLPPKGNLLNFNFKVSYVAPAGNQLDFNFKPSDDGPVKTDQYLYPASIHPIDVPAPVIKFTQFIKTTGIVGLSFGQLAAYNKTQHIKPLGLIASGFSANHKIINNNYDIKPSGFNTQLFGTARIYNLRQYIRPSGTDYLKSDAPFVSGGVKYVKPSGIASNVFGTSKIYNKTETQYLRPQGILSNAFGQPQLSPRTIFTPGIQSLVFGLSMVRRNPSPQGFIATTYGVPWVSRSPRELMPFGWNSLNPGHPKIYDPTQRINLAEMVMTGGIFGDVAIRNKNKWLKLDGFESAEFSRWAVVASNKRSIDVKGIDSYSPGQTLISNKSATLAPHGIHALNMGSAFIGYRIRTLKQNGIHSLVFGRPALNQTPALKSKGINDFAFGTAFVSYLHRHIEPKNNDVLKMGEPTIWFAKRSTKVNGFDASLFGRPVLSHEIRTIQTAGSRFDGVGLPWISFARRWVQPESIYREFPSNHKVGGTQSIQVSGFDATQFGTRIIPERLFVYPRGFANNYGEPTVELKIKYIQPKGFITVGQEPRDRWGSAKTWNRTQYITQYFDHESGLVPPAWPKWMLIENRNKKVQIEGFNSQKFGYQMVANNARLLQPKGFDAFKSDQSMISHRLRKILPDGLEQPYFSGWTAVHNGARVISPFSIKPPQVGVPESVLNTRRYYRRVGNFESLQMGQPFIADRVRKIHIESRYSIHPPTIPLPNVKLHTRYVELYEGFDSMHVGMPALSVHWNKITTRWTLQNLYGFPEVRNVTPEHRVFGHDSAEFGVPSIRTQWRDLYAFGENSASFGKPTIKDRKQKITVGGMNPTIVSDKLKVIKGVSPPYSMQLIIVDLGIEPLFGRVGKPSLNQNVVQVYGFNSLKFGEASIRSNGVVIEAGIFEENYGEPFVSLKNRVIQPEGMSNVITPGIPRVSPHTIYAVMEAPEQARNNHPSGNLHYVNSDSGRRPPGEVFGKATVRLKLDQIRNAGLDHLLSMGIPDVMLKRRYIQPKGLQAYRMGWHNVGDGTQFVRQFSAPDFMQMGSVDIGHVEVIGDQEVKPSGLDSATFGRTHIELLHRQVHAFGFDSMKMGTRLAGDLPYMWQGLRVGELMPTIPDGFNAMLFGNTWISLKIREIRPKGFDSFIAEYDLNNFAMRMKVFHQEKPVQIQHIQAVGFDQNTVPAPNIKPKTQYIRPDGNSEQYRKGAF